MTRTPLPLTCHTEPINRTKPPKWCKQLEEWPKHCQAASGIDIVDGGDLAIEALGEHVKCDNSSLTAFAYLWRRFGPPVMGSDEHKQLCFYALGTPMRGVYLTLGLSGSSLELSVGYLALESVLEKHYGLEEAAYKRYVSAFVDWYEKSGREKTREAFNEAFYDSSARQEFDAETGPWPRRKSVETLRAEGGVVTQINDALIASLRELLRPVFIRDAAINIFGRLRDSDIRFTHSASPHELAGYGVPVTEMRRLAKEEE